MAAVDDTFGAWYIGQQVGVLLFGVSILQIWVFFTNGAQDPLMLKALVIFVMLCGLVQACLTSAGVYHFLVSSIGHPEELMMIPQYLNIEPFISSLNIIIIQGFYGFRVFRLTKSYLLLSAVLFFALSQFALGYAAAVIQLTIQGITSNALQKNLAVAALACDAACDAIISLAMVSWLQKHRSGFKGSETVMTVLMNYTLASGFLTFVGSVLVLATWIGRPDAQIYSAISFTLPHLYSNSLMALLNARRVLRKRFDRAGPTSGILISRSLPIFAPSDEYRSSELSGSIDSTTHHDPARAEEGRGQAQHHTIQLTELSDEGNLKRDPASSSKRPT